MSNFKRNAVQLSSGTIVSQAIILSITPILTRLIEPSSFGAMAIFSGIYAVLAGVLTLKYEQSILLPKSNTIALGLTSLVIQLSALLSLLLFITLIVASTVGELSPYWLFLPVCTFLAALQSSIQQWCARACEYRYYSKSLLIGACVNGVVCLVLALLAWESYALVMGFSCGQAASVAYMLSIQRSGFEKLLAISQYNCRTLIGLAQRYREFPLFVVPTSLVAGAISYAPPLVLGISYSLDLVGHYSIATKFVLLPSILIGYAVSEAFRAEIMFRIRESQPLVNFTQSLFLKGALIAIPSFGLIVLLGPLIFSKVFGDQFEQSGNIVRVIALAALGMLISQPLQAIFIGLRRSKLWLILQTILCGVPLLLLSIKAQKSNLEHSLLWYSSSILFISLMMFVVAVTLILEFDRTNGHK